MSKAKPLEDLQKRRQHSAEWFDLALANAEAAVLLAEQPKLRCQSLFLTQQAMEAATKGFARNAGLPHDKLRDWSHNNLNLFLWCVDAIIESAEITEHIRNIFSTEPHGEGESDVIMQLKSLLEKTADPQKAKELGKEKEDIAREYFAFVLTLPPEGVATLLRLMDRVQDRVTEQRETSEPIIAKMTQVPVSVQELSPEANIVTTLTPQIILHCHRRMPDAKLTGEKLNFIRKLTRQILLNAIKDVGETRFRADLKANKGRIYLDNNQIMAGSFDVPMAIMGVFILGTVVWPHESYSRYPAPPGAPDDFRLAAAPRKRKIGIKHYSEDLGVISHIQELAGRAQGLAESLLKAYKTAWLS